MQGTEWPGISGKTGEVSGRPLSVSWADNFSRVSIRRNRRNSSATKRDCDFATSKKAPATKWQALEGRYCCMRKLIRHVIREAQRKSSNQPVQLRANRLSLSATSEAPRLGLSCTGVRLHSCARLIDHNVAVSAPITAG
jgi:hypothetical protein